MTHADILALSSNANPRLIHASDTGFYYTIAAAAAGSTAVVVGNAVVATNASILPAQALVDNYATLIDSTQTTLDLASKGLTKVSGALIAEWIQASFAFNGSAPTIDLSGNALTAASVNDILLSISEIPSISTYAGMTVDISGGTSSAPTDHQDAIITLNFTSLVLPAPEATDIRDGLVGTGGAYEGMFLHIGTEDPAGTDQFSNSQVDLTLLNGIGLLFIGAGDLPQPTAAQIVTKLVNLGGGAITNIGSNTARIVIATDKLYPYDIDTTTLTSKGITGTVVQAGHKSSKATLIDAGLSVTTN